MLGGVRVLIIDEIAAVIAWVEGASVPSETRRQLEYRRAALDAALFMGWFV